VRGYSSALRTAVDAPKTLIAAANDLSAAGHPAAALPLARRAVLVAGNNPAAHEALGNALLGIGQVHAAGLEYNKTAEWWPHRTAALKRKLDAYAARRAANPTPAERAYRRARQLEAAQVGPRQVTEEVERLSREAVRLDPGNPNYLWHLLRIQMAKRQTQEALESVRTLLAVSPEDGRAHAMAAVLLAESAAGPDDFARIENHIQKAKSDPAAEATRLYAEGLLALLKKDGQRAAMALRLAAAKDGRADVVFYKLSQAEALAGNQAAAEEALAIFRRRQEQKRLQAEVLGDIAQNPRDARRYERAAAVFESHGLAAQAEAIRREARRRFGAPDARGRGRR